MPAAVCRLLALLMLSAVAGPALAAVQLPLLSVTGVEGTRDYSMPLQILLVLTALSFLPLAFMVTTSFTRILIVLAILRQALGLQQTPPTRLLIGLAFMLTLFVMRPVFEEIRTGALGPWLEDKTTMAEAARAALVPLHRFMRHQTRQSDLEQFYRLSGDAPPASRAEIPLTTLVPAFLASELKTAFQIGFMLFLPFLAIDLIIASILMALGMMMLSPLVISLPFKLMLFVLVDGWGLTVGSLARSFG